mmetsp:Transcript_160021/g.513415  ORF Transcript_160021/g.513415 Transcript_160021/m.513415 type:complete len:95 (+) Transcript_160021:288-572(+)
MERVTSQPCLSSCEAFANKKTLKMLLASWAISDNNKAPALANPGVGIQKARGEPMKDQIDGRLSEDEDLNASQDPTSPLQPPPRSVSIFLHMSS